MLLTSRTGYPFGALPRGVYRAEARTERTRLLEMVWRGDTFESATTSTDVGCHARVIGERGESFAWATGVDVSDVVATASRSGALLQASAIPMAGSEPLVGDFPALAGEPPEAVHPGEKAALLAGYHAAALGAHPAVTGALVHYREVLSEVDLTSTDGTAVHTQRRDLTLQITVYAGGGSHRPAGSVSIGSGGDFAAVRDLTDQIERAAATAVDLIHAPAVGDDVLDVVCDGALAGAWVHETLGHLSEADHQIGDGTLQAALRPGRRLGPGILTVSDNPGQPGARGYVPVDDEGSRGRAVRLVAGGVVDEPRLHHRGTAGAFGDRLTGNGRSVGFRHPPLPRLRTLCVEPGGHTDDDLIAGVEHGLLAEGLLGGQTDRRGFTFTPAACRIITHGSVGRLVRGVVLSGAVLDAFGTIDAIGDSQWRGDTSAGCGKQGQYPLAVTAWCPPVRLRGLRVRTG